MASHPKSLFILSIASGYGGAERSIEVIAPHLPGDLAVRIYAESAEHIKQLSRPGVLPPNVTLIRVAGSGSMLGRNLTAFRLLYDLRRHRPEAVLVNTHASALIAAMAARFLPELGRHCHLYVRDFLWHDLDCIFARLAGARVLVPSRAVLDRLGYLTPFHVRTFGTSTATVMPDMVELPSGEVTYQGAILHLATLNAFKGHVDLVLALNTLKAQDRLVRIDSHGVVGDGVLLRGVQRLIRQLDIGDCFRLGGYLPDPAPLLRDCQAVVVASVSHSGGPEAFCRAIIEAWSYRKPVVAYAAGAPAWLINHEVDGLLVPEGDLDALAAALWRLQSSPALCRQLGEAGYANVVASYEAGEVTHRLMNQLGA